MSNEDKLAILDSRLAAVELRNVRVEDDKAWETSRTRLVAICVITYVVACAVLWTIGAERFWLGALMPVVGFYLSTQSLPELKRCWLARRAKQANRSEQ